MKTCTIFLSPSSLSRRLLHPFFLVPSFSHLLPLDHRPPPALTIIFCFFTKRSPTSPPFLFFLFCFPLLSSPIIKAITIATAIDAGDRASIDPCCCYSCCQHLTLTIEESRTSDSHQLHPFGRPCCYLTLTAPSGDCRGRLEHPTATSPSLVSPLQLFHSVVGDSPSFTGDSCSRRNLAMVEGG